MLHRLTRAAGTGHSQRLWPVFLILIIAVALPSAGVLWFMNEAMQNEHLAVRQRLTEVYRSQLQAARSRVQAYWLEELSLLTQVPQQTTGAAAFASLVQSGKLDSVLIYDREGHLIYPNLADTPRLSSESEMPAWRDARRLEYEKNSPAAAAKAYMQIARQAGEATESAQALLAQARCLSKAGQPKAAIDILTGTLSGSRYRKAVDPQGRLILPYALLLALNVMKGPSHPLFAQAAVHLAELLNGYEAPLMPSTQRRFLMKELQSLWPACPPFPTMDAEELAVAYLESHPSPLEAGKLKLTGLPEIWAFQAPDKSVVALFRLGRLQAAMQSAIEAQSPIQGVRFALLPPGSAPSEGVAFLSTSLGEGLSSWQVVLSLEGQDPFTSVSRQRNAVYLWTAILLTAVLVLMALLIAAYLQHQIRLTRLKNDLIATVSHELKTPLASMRLLVDTLLAGHYQDAHQVTDYLELIARENSRLSSLIDNFLAFSRMERNKTTFERSVLQTEEIVNAAVEAVGDRLKAPGCHLEVSLAPALPPVSGDRDALVTVMVNLIDNALKYSGADKQIQLRSFASNGTVCIEVGDNGIGFSRRAAKRIFDRFYQVDQSLSRRAGGCGLGLSIVKFIVTAHGGVVSAKSQPGKGSTFVVQLPAMKVGSPTGQ